MMIRIKTIDFRDGCGPRHHGRAMDNLYALEVVAHERLERARAEAARHALLRRRRRPRAWRVRVGAALIALGERLLAGAVSPVRGASPAP
jgi:hypothetical protein